MANKGITLFIVGPPFGCRVCMRLAYQSQRQSPEERIRTRALSPGHLLNGRGVAFDYGLSDEDLDNDFDEELEDDELEDDELDEELEDYELDEELGEGEFD